MIALDEVADKVVGKRPFLRFDAGGDQIYALFDYYCTQPGCPCDEASIRLCPAMENPSEISFRAPFGGSHPIFDEDSAPSDVDRAIAAELMADQRVHGAGRRQAHALLARPVDAGRAR